MLKKTMMKSLPFALGVALVAGAPGVMAENLQDSATASDLSAGVMLAQTDEAAMETDMQGKTEGHIRSHRKGKKHMDMFAKMDADADGSVTLEEHQDYWAAKFAKVDANGDGIVTKEEMKAKHREHKSDKAMDGQ